MSSKFSLTPFAHVILHVHLCFVSSAKNLAYGKQSFGDEDSSYYYDGAAGWSNSYPAGGDDPAISGSDHDDDEEEEEEEEEEETEESGSNDDTELHPELNDSLAQCTVDS